MLSTTFCKVFNRLLIGWLFAQAGFAETDQQAFISMAVPDVYGGAVMDVAVVDINNKPVLSPAAFSQSGVFTSLYQVHKKWPAHVQHPDFLELGGMNKKARRSYREAVALLFEHAEQGRLSKLNILSVELYAAAQKHRQQTTREPAPLPAGGDAVEPVSRFEAALKQFSRYEYAEVLQAFAESGFIGELKRKVNENAYTGEFPPAVSEAMAKLAKQGHVAAQFTMARYAAFGIGMPADNARALAWLTVAVAQNPPHGKDILELFMKYLDDEEIRRGRLLGEEYIRLYSDVMNNPSITIIR